MAYKKWIYASDVHGKEQDVNANKALFKFLDLWKPDIRILGGDLWDLSPLRKGAGEAERREGIRADMQAGYEWAEKFRPNHFLKGNHDQRIYDLAEEGTGAIKEAAEDHVKELEQFFKKIDCKLYPYDIWNGIFTLGKLRFLHGYSAGKSAAKVHVEAYDSCVFGHIHQFQTYTQPNKSKRRAWASGCLCKLQLKYLHRSINALAHEHGWTYGIIRDNGEFEVFQAKGFGNKWLVAKELIEL